jgi:hypothetical protein
MLRFFYWVEQEEAGLPTSLEYFIGVANAQYSTHIDIARTATRHK